MARKKRVRNPGDLMVGGRRLADCYRADSVYAGNIILTGGRVTCAEARALAAWLLKAAAWVEEPQKSDA